MDINFHYFAVKVLSVKAGFDESDAQTIAMYSQFVDDFNLFTPRNYSYVPEFARYLAERNGEYWKFYHVTTGFSTMDSYELLKPECQKRILIPFHFITSKPLTFVESDRKNYRVTPLKMDGTSLLQGFLKNAAEEYLESPEHIKLIKIGALLHTFADTYAHQRFSGFEGWENAACLQEAIDNISGQDITSSYNPGFYKILPPIGHANISTAADDSNISFEMLQEAGDGGPYQDPYSRNNTNEFLTAAREILNFLRSCRGLDKVDDSSWGSLEPLIAKGLLTSERIDVDFLKEHWANYFPDISFYYAKDDLLYDEDATPESKNDDFFYYNVFADQRRKEVDPSYTTDAHFELIIQGQ